MASWTFKGESGKAFTNTAVTFASQSVVAASVTFRSLEADVLILDYELENYAASTTLPELRQRISVYRDSTRFFDGHVIRVSPRIDSSSTTVRVEVAGPWWWLERIPMTSQQADGEGNNAERPMYVFGTFTGGDNMAINLANAVSRAISLGAPIRRGSIAASFTVPRITLSQSTCGSVIAELVRLIPDTMLYFDYADTGTDAYPTLKVERRGAATTRTIAVGTDSVVSLDVQPVIELEVAEVKVPYVTRSTTGETQFVTQDSGTASTGKVQILPVSGPEIVDRLPNDQLDTLTIANVYSQNDAGLASAIKKVVYPGWADMAASLAASGYGADNTQYGLITANSGVYSAAGVTVFRNSSAGSGGSTGVVYTAGSHAWTQTSYDASRSFVCFEDNQEPPQWAIDNYNLTKFFPHHIGWWDGNLTGGGGSTTTFVQDRRNYLLDIANWSEALGSHTNTNIDATSSQYFVALWYVDKKASIWTCPTASIPSDNVLIRDEDFTFAAPPASFAANLLAAQNWIPHEGNIELIESDTGATRYRGCKVNITGSLSTLTSAGALVVEERVNIADGGTSITLGQPPRLDFVEFASRVRRTPQDNTQYIGESNSVTPLLDAADVPAATIAYGLRKLRAAYSGNAVKLRRTTGSVEVDVAFDSYGRIGMGSAITVTSGSYSGTMTLEAFSAGDDCFVKTWYDQSGNSRDLSQTTAASQPKLIDGGALLDAPLYDGTDDLMVSGYEFESTYDDVQWMAVCSPSSLSSVQGLMSDIRTFNQGIEFMTDTTPKWRMHVQNDDFITTLAAPVAGTDYLVNISYRKTSLSGGQGDIVRVNGSQQIKAVNKNLFASQRTPFFIGARRAPNHGGASYSLYGPWHGKITEVCGWEGVLTTDQSAAVEANVAAYHSITLP